MEKHPLFLESKINGEGEVEETKNGNNESLKKYLKSIMVTDRSSPDKRKKKKKKLKVGPTKCTR